MPVNKIENNHMMVQTNYKTAEDEEKNTRQEYTLHKHVHMNSSARGENY